MAQSLSIPLNPRAIKAKHPLVSPMEQKAKQHLVSPMEQKAKHPLASPCKKSEASTGFPLFKGDGRGIK
ncbi:hypothetical protein MC7420_3416 [Coleofasciculus chthonoplastes PCC 7420]|uniref:Uncharacterized protein n=1 Tax=Coleofasciculus chthonoplastes PCC 7420 TaxID=118168 RepID=B4W3E4_9CYAN|nr:hypothetical protein MC7420_3416 [Coleofasciculus chthonoplastes PCC 7420]